MHEAIAHHETDDGDNDDSFTSFSTVSSFALWCAVTAPCSIRSRTRPMTVWWSWQSYRPLLRFQVPA